MVPVEFFDQLTAERARSLSQAVGSVRAVTDRWLRGEISTVQMRELVRRAGLPCSHASRTQPPTSTLDLQYWTHTRLESCTVKTLPSRA